MRVRAALLLGAACTNIGCDETASHHRDSLSYSFKPYDTHSTFQGTSFSQSKPSSNDSFAISGSVVPGEIYAQVFQEKRAGFNAAIYSDSCTTNRFAVGNMSYSFVLETPFARGSNTRLFLTHDKRYVLKIQDMPGEDPRQMYWREKAAMMQARHTGVVSVIEPEADLSLMTLQCQSRSYVMRRVPGNDLYRFAFLSTDRVMELGKHALRILEKFHDTGIIHGDIHLGNIMLGSVLDMENSLMLIDFGRSMLYIDPISQTHKPESEMMQFSPIDSLNLDILSINELEGRGVSRADDIFRLAEVLISLCLKTLKSYGNVTPYKVAELKRNRIFNNRVPDKLQELYRYAINLGFEEKPNYSFLD